MTGWYGQEVKMTPLLKSSVTGLVDSRPRDDPCSYGGPLSATIQIRIEFNKGKKLNFMRNTL